MLYLAMGGQNLIKKLKKSSRKKQEFYSVNFSKYPVKLYNVVVKYVKE